LPAEWTPLLSTVGGTLVERPTALPRIRWASTSLVLADREARLSALSAGVDASTVVLDESSNAREGGAGRVVAIDETDSDDRRISVSADGDGYLVVADSFDPWWTATVDGHETPVLRADHAMMAVAVPPGEHVVRFTYSLPRGPIVVSLASIIALLALVGADVAVGRRRRTGAAVSDPPSASTS
jgi:hypothetical protein